MSNKVVTKIDGKVMIVELPPVLDADFEKEISSLMQTWLLENTEIYAFDYKNTLQLPVLKYSIFLNFAKLAKQANKKIASLNMNNDMVNQIRGAGLLQAFNPVQNLDQIVSAANTTSAPTATAEPSAAKKPKGFIDVSVINPFINATTKTLDVQAHTKSTPGKPYLLSVNEKNYDPPIAIAGVITLSCSKFTGSITIAFPDNVFLFIYQNMFDEKHTEITNDIKDAAGEILNIIYGVAKVELNNLPGINLKPALPTVLSGEKISIRQRTSEKIIILPFKTDVGDFQMEIALEAA